MLKQNDQRGRKVIIKMLSTDTRERKEGKREREREIKKTSEHLMQHTRGVAR